MKNETDQRIEQKSQADLDKMRRAGVMLRSIREELLGGIRPGISTLDLDRIFARRVEQAGAKAAFPNEPAAATPWLERHKACLWAGEIRAVIAAIARDKGEPGAEPSAEDVKSLTRRVVLGIPACHRRP